ncbi:hypothetical protein F2Q68_00001731 [Brassica cretica]|uniref:Uncharacterized protein n=1 Tax=Brassica cretica TaxID=69181 RepID=A0A8S9JAK3_BRACR|nr:hypothetical protein F2Q68_00001731 [Brassica cretica]
MAKDSLIESTIVDALKNTREAAWLFQVPSIRQLIQSARGMSPSKKSTRLLIWQWSSSQLSSFINQDSESVAVLGGLFPKLPHALNGVGTGDSVSEMVLLDAETISSIASLTAIFDAADLLTMMALETLMFLPCEIVWNCQDAKEVSQALVGSALMVEALKLRSALLKAKELILLSFHIFSNSRVFTFTLRLGYVLNEIAGVFHDVRSLATLFNPLSFSFIFCFDNVQVVSLTMVSFECMNVKNYVVCLVE